MRIIAEESYGHWSARFDEADCPSAVAGVGSFGGPDAFGAIRRLLENSPARHLSVQDFRTDFSERQTGRLVLVLTDADGEATGQEKDRCPECGGTGRYIGLNRVELCPTCGGSGSVSHPD